MNHTRSIRLAAAAGSLLLLATGCTTAREAEARANASLGHSGCPVEVNQDFTGTVRIGYQGVPNANLYVKDARMLETCLPKGRITWIKFDSGADVVQAFGSGSVDLATLGSSPATKALSAPLNVDMQVIWVDDVIGRAESLVAKDPAVKSLADLKGRTIATPFSSTSHYSLLQALGEAGMRPGADVKLINLAPDKMASAWNGDQLDAAWVWDPAQTALVKAGGHVVTGSDATAKAGHPTYDLEGATRSFIEANGSFLKTWTQVQDAAARELVENPEKAAPGIGVQLGTETAAVQKQLAGYEFPDASQQAEIFQKLGGQLHSTAEFLDSQGEIDAVASQQTYDDGLYVTAIDEVAR